jgi:hypothetical protein
LANIERRLILPLFDEGVNMQVLVYRRAVHERLGKLGDSWRSSSSWGKINIALINSDFGEEKAQTCAIAC